MPEQPYSEYSLSDFLEDDAFVRWVTRPNAESNSYWNNVLQQYPHKKPLIQQAAALIKSYQSADEFSNDSRKDEVWSRINTTLKGEPRLRVMKSGVPVYWKIAAAVTSILFSSVALWFFITGKETITTAHNEVTTVTLPDHTIVTLNGNSSLRYHQQWTDDEPREVWLDGEAYFNVQHINKDTSKIKASDRFIVHSNELHIEVLGTSFNVRSYQDRTNITLITGKVKVLSENKEASLNGSRGVIMLPGDHLEYGSNKLIAKENIRNPEKATAWISQEFVFNNAYLKEIVKKLIDDYGYTVEVKDPELLELKIEGEISVANIKELFAALSATLGLSIEEKDKHIIIAKEIS
jgi:transmembrane sensor